MTRPEERSKRRVWKSREIVKRKGINMSRELAEMCVGDGELYNMYAFERAKDF
jgi:hypothetical protein